jgi:hypothetical protein
VIVETNVAVPMRDGVVLRADVHRPPSDEYTIDLVATRDLRTDVFDRPPDEKWGAGRVTRIPRAAKFQTMAWRLARAGALINPPGPQIRNTVFMLTSPIAWRMQVKDMVPPTS